LRQPTFEGELIAALAHAILNANSSLSLNADAWFHIGREKVAPRLL
jgi:hypothetical protein